MASIQTIIDVTRIARGDPRSSNFVDVSSPSQPLFASLYNDTFCRHRPVDTNTQPPQKKRRLTADAASTHDNVEVFDPKSMITLAIVSLDLNFTGSTDPVHDLVRSASQTGRTSVSLRSVERCSPDTCVLGVSGQRSDVPIHVYGRSSSWSSVVPHLEKALLLDAVAQSKVSRASAAALPIVDLCLPADGQEHLRLELRIIWRIGHSFAELRGAKSKQDRIEYETLSSYFHGDIDDHTPWSLQDFYENVHVPPTHVEVSPKIQDDILCDLYPFQKRTVHWLLQREGVHFRGDSLVRLSKEGLSENLPPSFHAARDATGRPCYVSLLRRMVVTDCSSLPEAQDDLRGGILAEEMGLGKTVELISLICSHQRKIRAPQIVDPYTGADVTTSGATLIITPPSILEQWKTEINQHAPHLKVLHYGGMPHFHATGSAVDRASVANLLSYDVVLTTYPVLSREIHFAYVAPERSLRQEKKHRPRRSPLMQIGWWRVCLDEAQMVESGVSQAATVARLVPRVNAWAISGTPLKKDVHDLLGLLMFLRYRPYCNSKRLWEMANKRLITDVFGQIALRHTKALVREELRLPPQKRVVITIPFTAVEEQNYEELLRQACDACGLTTDGAPLSDTWDADAPAIVEKMRQWLRRLRQTCLHPQVGNHNRRALGRGTRPLRTVDEVLEVMIDQNEVALRAEERKWLIAQVTTGHVLGYNQSDAARSQKALDIYMHALSEANTAVDECRRDLAEEIERSRVDRNGEGGDLISANDDDADVDDDLGEKAPRLAARQKALRNALEVQHMCNFYSGTAYFQLKSDESLTPPESEKFHRLERLETSYYDAAKAIRKEVLRGPRQRAERVMTRRIRNIVGTTVPGVVSSIEDDYGGIENRRVLGQMDHLAIKLNEQADQIYEWRAKIVDILLQPLIDEEHGKEITGEEYESSTKVQDELYVYITALRAVIADRNLMLTGQENTLIEHENKTAVRLAKDGEGHAPELLLRCMGQRKKLEHDKDDTSLRGVIAQARTIATALHWQSDGGSQRASAELKLVESQISKIQDISSAQSKDLARLEREMELFRTCMNLRLEFYRQLQHISDTVAPYKDEMDETLDADTLARQKETEKTSATRLATLRTKRRFLQHLRADSTDSTGSRLCVICQESFEVGVLTVCGHQYCKECIRTWWSQHRTCPMCKKRLHLVDFHEITYKPRELRAQEEEAQTSPPKMQNGEGRTVGSSIYSGIGRSTLDDIKSIDLAGSYGTKVDTLARHIVWLRQTDAGAKSIIFSQYSDFLVVLGRALEQFKIGFTSITTKGGIERFRHDPSAECFLLDAKSDSSGLNLVNATHVFLCEPLINPAIELQAIARVHRIGQQRPTTIYMYLINDTVEEAIYETSVSRRLEHMNRRSTNGTTLDEDGAELHESTLDVANTQEMQRAPLANLLLQKGGGELVAKDDLWRCLFGKRRDKQPTVSADLETQVDRHLRAEAAEGRITEGIVPVG